MSSKGNSTETKWPKYDHQKHSESRDDKFKAFHDLLGSYLGAKHAPYGSTALVSIDKSDMMWGLEEKFQYLMLEDGWKKDQKEVHKWTKVQAEILNILLHNFRDHDKVILDAHAQANMQKEYAEKYQQLPDYDRHKRAYIRKICWLPYGTLCFDAIQSRYTDGGAHDALSKIIEFDTAKIFTPTKVLPWTEVVEMSWRDVNKIVEEHSPSYLAAMQLLMHIQNTNDESWKQFAVQFKSTKKNKPFTVDALLEAVRDWNTHLRTADKHKQAALSIAANHAASVAHHTNVAKLCAASNCNVPVPQPHHKWCDTHFKKNGRGKGGGAGLPDKVQAELAVKRKEKMRANFAKMKEKQKAKKAAQKATVSLAIPMGPFPFPGGADAPVCVALFLLNQ